MACHNPEEYVGDLLETHGLPRPSHEDLGNPNRPIIRRKIDQQSKPPNEEKTPEAQELVLQGPGYYEIFWLEIRDDATSYWRGGKHELGIII